MSVCELPRPRKLSQRRVAATPNSNLSEKRRQWQFRLAQCGTLPPPPPPAPPPHTPSLFISFPFSFSLFSIHINSGLYHNTFSHKKCHRRDSLMAPEKTDSQKRGACLKCVPRFVWIVQTVLSLVAGWWARLHYVWGRFRLGLTLDYTVFVFMYLWMYVDALFWKGIERIEVFRTTVKTTYQLSFTLLHVHLSLATPRPCAEYASIYLSSQFRVSHPRHERDQIPLTRAAPLFRLSRSSHPN